MFGIGTASPSYSLSSPAMMRKRLDFPEPFTPSTPILAPGKNDSEMSFRITRLGGTILPTRFMLYTYCAIFLPTGNDKGRDYRIGGRRAGVENDEGGPRAALVLHAASG